MKILFLCTAHNSLSQRLYLALSRTHEVSIEYALSDELMISAVEVAAPELVICPFLTTLVPREIHESVLTLIVHPGPPGDIGPSALDWVLMGDDGSTDDETLLLERLDSETCAPGRTHWAVAVLQATENFDAGPIWAFDDFQIDIDQTNLTKSELYRGPITQAAINATLAAVTRIQISHLKGLRNEQCIPSSLQPDGNYGRLAVTSNLPFPGGKLHHRSLLKASQREFDVHRHSAQQISRRIRCADSQPGVLSKVFGINMYIYGGIIDDNADYRLPTCVGQCPNTILGFRNRAVCISTYDGKGVWITHVRRPKRKFDSALWPKIPATTGLIELGLITDADVSTLSWPMTLDWKRSSARTFQEVWVDIQVDEQLNKTAYLYFDFYNGAMSTDQCSHLIEAMDFILSESTVASPIQAVVLMGGSYFSNGIALNVIEAASDPAKESWLNINRIDDVVHYVLHQFPARNIVTVAAIRGNAAAGGVALATACDIVIAGSSVVLNPAYRAVGLYGSEYHTLSYYGRCGQVNAKKILRDMTCMTPHQAQSMGLVDYVFPGTGSILEDYIRTHVAYLLKPGILKRGLWKRNVDTSPAALARIRANELGEMGLDFWSARSTRYHTRRFDFVRKVKPMQTPLRFATHRKNLAGICCDDEDTDDFDSVEYYINLAQEKTLAALRQALALEAASVDGITPYGDDDTSQPTPRTLDNPLTPAPSAGEIKTIETLFACYYKFGADDLPTPPESPLPSAVMEGINKFGILS